jgi:hypothetical protein
MTSKRKIQSNRANAVLSTGPKTASGKSVASRNAYKHGLAAHSSGSSAESRQDLATSLLIQGHACDIVQAEVIAEAELHLIRIRKVRADIINAAIWTLHVCHPTSSNTVAFSDYSVLQAILTVLPDLERTERYERRCLSRRRRATRNLYGASI